MLLLSIDEPSKLLLATLAVAALVLAYFSWKYVETPFRNKQRFNRKKIFMYGVLCSALFVALGLVGHLNDGLRNRLPPNIGWQSFGEKLNKNGDICEPKPIQNYLGVMACEFGDKNSLTSVLLYGDSHAQAISEELHKRLIGLKLKGIKVGLDGCSVVPQIYETKDLKNLNECEKKFKVLLSYIKASSSEIIISSRWTFRLFPIPGEVEQLPFVNSDGGKEKVNYREYVAVFGKDPSFEATEKRRALRYFIDGILSTGLKVFFIYPVPEIAWDIAKMNRDYYSRNGTALSLISINYNDFLIRNRFVNQIFKEFEAKNNFMPIKPESVFCDSFVKGRCVAQYDTIPFYYDDDHLSDVGAKFLVDKIFDVRG